VFLDSDGGDPDLAAAFDRDWREGLVMLAAAPRYQQASLAARFWRLPGSDYLSRVCHLDDGATAAEVQPPSSATLEQWQAARPPMAGGEYVTAARLAAVWQEVADWGAVAMAEAGSAAAFLAAHAPAWRRVGRVTFHLAENKPPAARPFAFMASFTTGLDDQGRPRHLPLGRALELHAGTRNRAALLRLLSPVDAAARQLDWVRELVDSGDIYRAKSWTAGQALRLLESVEQLDAAGLVVRLPASASRRAQLQVKVTIDTRKESLVGADAIMAFDIATTLDGEPLTDGDLDTLMAAEDNLVFFKGRWVELDRDQLQRTREYWDGLAGRDTPLGFHEGMRLLAGASADLGAELPDEVPEWSTVVAGDGLRDLLEGIRDPAPLRAGRHLNATLRPYQQDGVRWLRLLTGLGLGACLADDMGLGKTLQVLALLTVIRRGKQGQERPPALLIVPASLLGNWQAEAERFTPGLRLRFLHPSCGGRAAVDLVGADPDAHLGDCDLVVTTYGMALRLGWLAERTWDLLILDEAQAIKNHGTKQSRAIRRIPARARVALTGTPIENSLGDLWSLFDTINPGLLGSSTVFKRFVTRLEKSGGSYEPLRRLAGPYILRRLKTDPTVIDDLPDKSEVLRHCRLTAAQAAHYRSAVDNLAFILASTEQGIERRGAVLQSLLRLKQICNHPSQYTGDGDFDPRHSGKFSQLAEIGAELAARQEKVLVFTQFREVIPALEAHLARIFGQAGLMLHGGTPVKARAAMVARFQDDLGPPFMVLSLKAGGTGLNLTAASHVVHFDRWWNPAVENQATDRAYRIGQHRNVLVHKFVTAGTIEERIDRLIAEKQALADNLLGGGEVKLTELADDELLDLVRLDIDRALI
jgi:non-specific serine/threonine protein kinase